MISKRNDKHLEELARKWKDGSITAAERVEFNEWYDAFDDTELEAVSAESVGQLRSRLYANIRRAENIMSDSAAQVQPLKTFKLWYRMAAAAVILVLLSAGLYFYTSTRPSETNQYAVQDDVKPGGAKAVLTLADGRSIILTDAADGKLAEQSGIGVTKTKDGQLVYQFDDAGPGHEGAAQYNTISTPKGGKYQVNLPDGTQVWLNAASVIKFPVTFASLKERKVELQGEAYFEVFKDKHKPFKVVSGRQEVEVLGTHFNINTYQNEGVSKTTLLEGSVKLHVADASDVTLKPGEQSVVGVSNVAVHKVNTDQVVAWKNGNFQFNDESLISIMKQLERWYDVEVDYSTVPDTHYEGFISRNVNLSQVLNMMEITGNLKFKIKGKVISVYQ